MVNCMPQDAQPVSDFSAANKILRNHLASIIPYLTLKEPKMKIFEFANRVDPEEAAHNELPSLGLHCLPSSP